MAACVLYSPYAIKILRKHGIQLEDEMLITAILEEEPRIGKLCFRRCQELRVLSYKSVYHGQHVDIVYLCLQDAILNLPINDRIIVIGIGEANSTYGKWLEPEGLSQMIEVIYELTRHVFS